MKTKKLSKKCNFIHIRVFDKVHRDFKKSVLKQEQIEGRTVCMTDILTDAMKAHISKWLESPTVKDQ